LSGGGGGGGDVGVDVAVLVALAKAAANAMAAAAALDRASVAGLVDIPGQVFLPTQFELLLLDLK
jgi:hypothetical protein